jgi:hypothetical protein
MNNRPDDDSLETSRAWVRDEFGKRGLADVDEALARHLAKANRDLAYETLAEVSRYAGPIDRIGAVYWSRFKERLRDGPPASARAPQTPLDFTTAPVRLDVASTALVMAARGTLDEASIATLSPDEHAKIARRHPMFDQVTGWYALARNGTRPTLGHLLGAIACCSGNPLRDRAVAFFTAAFAGESIVEGHHSNAAALLFQARHLRAGVEVLNGNRTALLEDKCRTLSAWLAHVGNRPITRLASIRNSKVPEPSRGPWVNR